MKIQIKTSNKFNISIIISRIKKKSRLNKNSTQIQIQIQIIYKNIKIIKILMIRTVLLIFKKLKANYKIIQKMIALSKIQKFRINVKNSKIKTMKLIIL